LPFVFGPSQLGQSFACEKAAPKNQENKTIEQYFILPVCSSITSASIKAENPSFRCRDRIGFSL